MLHNYVTNEFNNSAVAKNKSDVRTTWAEAKWMVIVTVPMIAVVMYQVVRHFG